MLDKEESARLVAIAKLGGADADAAKTTLLEANSPLIKSIIKRYIGKGVEYDDLYQLGCLGFVKALNKYDETFGVKFTTYAVPLIMGEVKRFLRDDGTIKVSRSVKGLYIKIKKYLAINSDKTLSVDDLATYFEVAREDIIYAMEASHLPISMFDKPYGEDGDGISVGERIAGADSSHLVDNIMLKNMLESLCEKDRKIIILRYFRNLTQSAVAKHLNISQVQVSRIEQRVIKQFREFFLSPAPSEINASE